MGDERLSGIRTQAEVDAVENGYSLTYWHSRSDYWRQRYDALREDYTRRTSIKYLLPIFIVLMFASMSAGFAMCYLRYVLK